MSTQSPPFGPWSHHWHRGAEHLHERLLHAAGRHQHGPGRFGPRGFGRGFPFGPPFMGGRRAGRGDIRAAIIALLAEQPMHGYQVIQELTERSGGAWRPSPGSVYPTLQQLEDEGLVRAAQSEAGRRVFELTDAGHAEAAGTARDSAPWEEASGGADADLAAMRDLCVQVGAATWQVAHAGTGAQHAAAAEILREARRRLYQLLAEDSPAPAARPEEGSGA
jgi:DNA-binding PadR family transcriptional regulator